MGDGRNGNSSQVRHIESFTTVNNQLNTQVTFLPEVLTESQCVGPTHLMETIATAIGDETKAKYVILEQSGWISDDLLELYSSLKRWK